VRLLDLADPDEAEASDLILDPAVRVSEPAWVTPRFVHNRHS
jgi:hypothetical protein